MTWESKCLYDHLHAAWTSGNRSRMKPWLKYLRLFKIAFDKLPSVRSEIWQGTHYDKTLKEMLISKSTSLYLSLNSCSPSKDQIINGFNENVGQKWMLIGYISVNGKLATGYTADQYAEVLVWPGTKLEMMNMEEYDDNDSVTFYFTGQNGK